MRETKHFTNDELHNYFKQVVNNLAEEYVQHIGSSSVANNMGLVNFLFTFGEFLHSDIGAQAIAVTLRDITNKDGNKEIMSSYLIEQFEAGNPQPKK